MPLSTVGSRVGGALDMELDSRLHQGYGDWMSDYAEDAKSLNTARTFVEFVAEHCATVELTGLMATDTSSQMGRPR